LAAQAETGQGKQTAFQELVWNLGTLANTDLGNIENPQNFYPYNQPRAHYELEYRKALKTQIENMQSNANQPGANSGSNLGL
jgi:hypothetical protein